MACTVSVWLLRTEQPAAVSDRLIALLDDSELNRAEAVVEPDVHAEFVVSHGAARLIVAGLLGVPPRTLRWRYGSSGKPSLAEPVTDLQISLSHSEGLAAIAVSAGRAVGVDVQRRRDAIGLIRMAKRYYPPAEAHYVAQAADPDEAGRRFSMLWARKEAAAKVGGGRLIPTLAWPSCVRADPGSADDECQFRSGSPGNPVRIQDLPVPDGFHGAVALAGEDRFRVLTHWWSPQDRYDESLAARPLAQIGVPMAVPGC
jgi:4'-phosphopantetheinyl transferase